MSKDGKQEIPDVIYDSTTKTSYQKGRFFGKGGFAKCYEITDCKTKDTFAGKVVSKTLLSKENQRLKMMQEIKIHKALRHKHVVGFYNFFEDHYNVYIVMELCKCRSMMELHKRRKTITEPETRFYMSQLLSGVFYLHNNNIIHRDLKLGNLFLNDELHVKIGDFGLAAKIEFDGERKKTLCGTPNYIAPEILTKQGHSYEVDIWSIGCIMYTLLIGRPPFETESLKETYSKIKNCDYRINTNISATAKTMIAAMLQSDPKRRPKVIEMMKYEFMKGYTPPVLPTSALTMAPRFDKVASRKPLVEVGDPRSPQVIQKPDEVIRQPMAAFNALANLRSLRNTLASVLASKPVRNCNFGDEMSDPNAHPLFWVSKWVDYSDKYGFGYQLCDESVGVMFNDSTKLIMLANGVNVHYIDKNEVETYMLLNSFPVVYEKKMKLLSYFTRYMKEHLVKTGGSNVKEIDSVSRVPHLHQWCRSTTGVLMQLNNGTVQMNFSDHTKIIMCTLMSAITYIDDDKSFRTFRFQSIINNGCSQDLYEKMRYAHDKVNSVIDDMVKNK
ncbi:serine/threonine-protein kinase polo [Onthophagus taurus]|uniref:serine/threonine-protein kinase polo n=1 Tax=Onthophagus taurus TaxID=166361 RepID=UPI000C20AC12|nr:serine/threonine-protein kinase polo [Onthophagus taurus]